MPVEGPLARIRRGEVSPPIKMQPPKKTKSVNIAQPRPLNPDGTVKKSNRQLKREAKRQGRESKGPISFPIMSTPCPDDVLEAAVWHGTRLAIKLLRFPPGALPAKVDGVPGPRIHPLRWEAASELAIACGFAREDGTRRGKRCFWECIKLVTIFGPKLEREIRRQALELVAKTVRFKVFEEPF